MVHYSVIAPRPSCLALFCDGFVKEFVRENLSIGHRAQTH